MQCDNCGRFFDNTDSEFIKWMGSNSAYCGEDCEMEGEFIKKHGEEEFKKSLEQEYEDEIYARLEFC
jgi:hypothetical protein